MDRALCVLLVVKSNRFLGSQFPVGFVEILRNLRRNWKEDVEGIKVNYPLC